MKDTIQKELAQIEQTQNVRILLAVESGSRAWGFASPDSDYDVRFIYVRPKDAYLRLQKHRDVIELPINDALDINGWDLTKTLRLLHKSNPTLFEWGASPIVYLETDFAARFKSVMGRYFSSKRGLYHYRQNFPVQAPQSCSFRRPGWPRPHRAGTGAARCSRCPPRARCLRPAGPCG